MAIAVGADALAASHALAASPAPAAPVAPVAANAPAVRDALAASNASASAADYALYLGLQRLDCCYTELRCVYIIIMYHHT